MVAFLQIGVQRPAEVADTDISEFEAFFNVNVKGSLLFVKAVSRVMKKQERRSCLGRTGIRDLGRGSIINIASCNSFVPTSGIVQYTSAKHALMGITKNAGMQTPVVIRDEKEVWGLTKVRQRLTTRRMGFE